MAQSVHDAELWLTSKFLTARDILGDKENNKNGVNAGLDAAFCFPSEFPYEFDSFGVPSTLSSPVESMAGSTETGGSDEEDFFAGLARRLSQSALHETRKLTVPTSARDKAEETSGTARSPQSTLTGIGSWSGRSAFSGDGSPNGPFQVPSPPTTPFAAESDAWDVIFAVAGQVARLKMNGEVCKYDYQNRELLDHLGAATPFTAAKNPSTAPYSKQSLAQTLNQPSQIQNQQARQEEVLKQQWASVWGRQAKANWLAQQQQQQIQNRGRNHGHQTVKCARPLSLPQSTWPPLEAQHQNQQVQLNGSGPRAVLHSGSGVKRGCAGTGVFLPRQYGIPPETRKKSSYAPVQLPAKVVHALNLNIDDLNATSRARVSGAFAADYDALIARRNTLLVQQRLTEESLNREIRLPQEWTY